jgi:hypothetical protein
MKSGRSRKVLKEKVKIHKRNKESRRQRNWRWRKTIDGRDFLLE